MLRFVLQPIVDVEQSQSIELALNGMHRQCVLHVRLKFLVAHDQAGRRV